jgi:hypothetical protein
MPEPIHPQDQKSAAPVEPARKGFGVGSGIALGCASNLVLAIAVPFLLLAVFGVLRISGGTNVVGAYLGIVLLVNACVIAFAYRRGEKGVVIGFAIAASLVVLLGSYCWSSS